MRSGNPALGQNTFLDIGSGRVVSGSDQAMSINGTVNKTGILLLLIMISAMYTWSLYTGPESMSAITPLLLAGGIGGFIVALLQNLTSYFIKGGEGLQDVVPTALIILILLFKPSGLFGSEVKGVWEQ